VIFSFKCVQKSAAASCRQQRKSW